MKCLKKFKLGFGITTIVMGAGLSALAGGLVAAGVNKETYLVAKSGDVNISVGYGVGNLNFGKISTEYVKTNSIISEKEAGQEAINKAQELKAKFEAINTQLGLSASPSKGDFINKAEKNNIEKKKYINEQINNKAYQDGVKLAQTELNNANEALKNIKPGDSGYAQALEKQILAELALDNAKKSVTEAQAIIDGNNIILEALNSSNAMMLSGSILLPIFVLTMVFGIAVTIVAARNKNNSSMPTE